jgi:hypothetical protein
MKRVKQRPQKRLLVIVALVAGASLWAYMTWHAQRYPTWTEEVQLSDGRVIVVRQKHEVYDNYGTNQSWVTFSLPEMGGERTWHSYLKPMRIDVHNGKVYVFGRPRGDRQVQYYDYPRHYVVAFGWNGTAFERIAFAHLPVLLRERENVFPCVPADRNSTVSWSYKEAHWCPPSDTKGLLTRTISLGVYEELARDYARRDGFAPKSN